MPLKQFIWFSYKCKNDSHQQLSEQVSVTNAQLDTSFKCSLKFILLASDTDDAIFAAQTSYIIYLI